MLNLFGKAGETCCPVPFLKVLIAAIAPGVWSILPIAHQTLPIAMARLSAVLFEEVVSGEKGLKNSPQSLKILKRLKNDLLHAHRVTKLMSKCSGRFMLTFSKGCYAGTIR